MEANNSATRERGRWYVASVGNADHFFTPGGVDVSGLGVDHEVDGEQFTSFDEALAWLEHERANVIDVMQRAQEIGEHRTVATLTDLMWAYFNFTKHWSEWAKCNELGLESARSLGDKRVEAYIRMNQGVLFTNLRRLPEAVENLEQAIRIFEETDDGLGLAYGLQNLANARNLSGQGDAALGDYARALEIFDTLPDGRRGRGITLSSLAWALINLHRYDEAITNAEQARVIFESLDADEDLAMVLTKLGNAHRGLSHTSEALEFYQSALRVQRRISHRHGEAVTRNAMGQLYADLAQVANARTQWQAALAIYVELDVADKVVEVTERLRKLPENG